MRSPGGKRPIPTDPQRLGAGPLSDLLPIMEPAYNLREICKQLILLEDHLFHPRKRCLDCIRKHLLTAEALAEEAVTLDVDGSTRESTDGLADQIREFWNAVQDVPEEDGSYIEVAQAVRDLRKGLVAQCYGVRVASWLDTGTGGFEPHPNGICPYRVLVRTAGYFSVGDQIFFGKYKNKRGVILRIFKDERGIPSVEIQPEPQGRKKNRTLGLFNIWHADLTKRAGRIIEFPGGREPPKARKTITIQGEKYALSDDPGDFMRVDEDEGDGDGARLVRGPSPTDPYRFLWVYDTDRRNIHMWRVTDGNEKASGFDSEFRAKIVALDRVGELNRVQTDQLRAIAREMNRRADEQFKSLQQFVDSQKDAYQHLVDEAAREVFEREIAPRIERRLDEIEQGVIPLGFKVNDRILEHVDEQRQVRHFVIGQEMERYTTDLIEAEVRRRGADPDAPGHDIQAAYWALHDVQAQAWERFDKRASAEREWQRLAAKYKNKKKVKTEDGDEATVYEYSEKQVEHRNREKANRVEALRKSIGDLRKQVKKDLDSKDPTTRLTALAVALIDETFERVGNDESAKDGHFGVTGWKVEHITFGDGKATLKYVGKSGVDQEKTVTDSKVVKALKAAVKGKKDSDEILCEGEDCRITATEVNQYLKPFDVTAKDIRGLHANETMRAELKKARKGALSKDKKERAKQLKDEFKEALEATAEAVGHEASTLRSQYLVPGLEDAFLKDGTVLDTLKKESKTATKSESEKEDEQAEHLIRPSPKVKPPRKDLHNNTVDNDESDPDEKQDDKDTSKNFKHQAAVEGLWDRLARQVWGGDPSDKQPRKPGEVWETSKGTWSAKSKDGDRIQGGFADEAEAKSWLSGDDEDEAEAEGGEDGEDSSGDEDAEAEKALAQAVDAAESAAKKIVGGKHLPEDFRDSLNARMQGMSAEDRAAFGQAFAETLTDLQENQGDEDLEAARKFLQANPDAKDSEGKAKHSADKVGRMVAEALYADRVVFNPFMIGGKVNDDVEAASHDDLKEGQEARMERARAAKAAYAKYTPEEVASLVEKLGAGPPPRSELDPDSPRARDIDAIYYGMSLAAMLKDKEPPDLSSAGWKEAKGVSAVRPSAHMNHLAQAMSRVGKEDLLLGTVEDFTAPESQAAVRSAFGSMPDKEIHEFVKGGPLTPLAEAMVARDKNGKFVLSEADRKQFRQMIEDSLVEDIALLDPLVGDYLDAKGKKNTQAARKKFVDEKRQEALEKNKDLHKAVKSWIEDSGGDNEDRASTDEFKALLEAAGNGSRNAVIDAVLEDAEDLNSDNAAIARAVRKENSTAAMEVRRVRDIADEQRPPGTVWDKGGEYFAKTPDGSVVGPFKNKDRANEWASGEVSEMRMTAGFYAFTVWPQLIRSSG